MNTEDERLKAIDTEKETALSTQNQVYNNLVEENQALLNKQNSWQDQYQTQQNALYDQSTELATSEIQQNQAKNEAAYQKEAAASESSYQKAINPYGVQAEQQASAGLQNTGYSETTKMMAYNTAKNRTATARASKEAINAEYENSIIEAKLSNDTQKATLALELLQSKLQNELTAFSTKSGLIQNQLTAEQNIDSTYYNRYQDVIAQQNYEKETANALKQYEEQLSYQKSRDLISDKQYQEQLAQAKSEAAQSQANWQKEFNASTYSNTSSTDETLTSGTTIQTDYYNGAINPDTANGTFNTKDANGVKYQPDNINGTKVKSSGKKVSDLFGTGNTGSTGANIDNQKVWKINNNYYIWDGSQNKYIDVTSSM